VGRIHLSALPRNQPTGFGAKTKYTTAAFLSSIPLTLTAREALTVERYEQTTKRVEVVAHQVAELKRRIGKASGENYVDPRIGLLLAGLTVVAIIWLNTARNRARQHHQLAVPSTASTLIRIVLPAAVILWFIYMMNIYERQPNVDEAAQRQQLEAQLKSASDEFLAFLKQAETEFSQPPSENDRADEIADTRKLQTALGQLKEQTGQNAVAIYTLVGADTYRALVITPNNIAAASQPVKGEALNEKSLQLWALLQSVRYDPAPLPQELYTTVFKPLESQLPKDTSTILWSLDGSLRYLPMAALHDGKQYLIERYNHVVFTRADSERLLRVVSPRWTGLGLGSSKAHTVELLGNRIAFNALPGVTEELRALFRQKGSSGGVLDGEVLPDARFTKTAMLSALKQKRPLVHISSHFAFRPGDEARSFLLLGDGSAMTLEEMKTQTDLFTGVELLTLSACNTAAQQAGADGREIDGFAELAQRLGAGSVMATLWPVADNSTPWLMREFYQTRQQGNSLTKAEAMRLAQLALLNGTAQTRPLPVAEKGTSFAVQVVIGADDGKRDGGATRANIVYINKKDARAFKRDENRPFAHPYFWAPFILIGNWK
jgi:CHAT domain-containing protein